MQMMQVLLHAANTSVDAHVVVVQDDEQIIGRTADVVHAFERKTATHASIAYHGHNFPLVIALLMSGNCHT